MTLDELRERLSALDRQLLALVAERQALSRQVAEVKRSEGRPTRDFRREREVLLQARAAAESLGVSPALAESVLRLLIRGSLTAQERIRVAAGGRGSGRTALVIGGAGKMGRWFCEFLSSQGYAVTIADPANGTQWQDSKLEEDLIVVATPLQIADGILHELAARRPRGTIFDIGSLKTPLRAGIGALQSAGCNVTSVHPMFGPDTELLSGRHVIFIDVGCPQAVQQARELFASTMAEQVVMTLDEHDRLIAYVLGLSHALNIVFFTALAESGEAAPKLARMSSTTFDSQLDVASRVAAESPELYYEIQRLNDYGGESRHALRDAVQRLLAAGQCGGEAEGARKKRRGGD
jgi:chorismate mutase/prephenate dehydrogenase